MSPNRTNGYMYLQIVPVLAFLFTAWLAYTSRALMESGRGDSALVGAILLEMVVMYLILPVFFMLDLYSLWKAVRGADSQRTMVVAIGLLMIVVTYAIFLRMTHNV